MNDNLKQDNISSIIIKDYLKEKKRKRIFRYILFFMFCSLIAYTYFIEDDKISTTSYSHTALIHIDSPIMSNDGSSSEKIIKALNKSFRTQYTKGIILKINSPGGSATQANEVYKEILRLRKEFPEKNIYAVCSDICTSAAYYIASATDEIHANQFSMIGSIGVIMPGFGFVDTIKKVGAERRVFTAGKEKAFLDPFLPLDEIQVNHLNTMLDSIHQFFIKDIQISRGSRLKDDPIIFSGRFWIGEQALDLGLIDGYENEYYIAKEIFKAERIVDYTSRFNYIEKLAQLTSYNSIPKNELYNFQQRETISGLMSIQNMLESK